jgi:nicotinamidase-related amidase
MTVIALPDLQSQRDMPLVMFINVQRDFASQDGARYIQSAEHTLERLRALLDWAREHGFPIAHFRQTTEETASGADGRCSAWMEGFTPRANEFVYEHTLPSCFSNESFGHLISWVHQPNLILAGFSGDQSCLSTAIDAFHRYCRVSFVQDCSATASLAGFTEGAAHRVLCNLISFYADVVSADDVMGRFRQYIPLRPIQGSMPEGEGLSLRRPL